MDPLARTPDPPYYAVIFTSLPTDNDEGYEQMAGRMAELAMSMPGFLGIEYAENPDGSSITASYWSDEAAICNWRQHAEHLEAQRLGRDRWYSRFELRVARVERAYRFAR
jgi:heme-degrading monooxygenase HmoA